jgi:hypothetical protein
VKYLQRWIACSQLRRTPYFSKIERTTVALKLRVDPKPLRAAIQAILANDPNTHTFVF